MVQEWIKTSEKVPTSNGEYIITYVYWDSVKFCGTVIVGTAEFDGMHRGGKSNVQRAERGRLFQRRAAFVCHQCQNGQADLGTDRILFPVQQQRQRACYHA